MDDFGVSTAIALGKIKLNAFLSWLKLVLTAKNKTKIKMISISAVSSNFGLFNDFEKSNFYQPSNFRTQEINSIGFVAIGKDFKPILDIIEVELF